jgi:hypothetical protein
MAVDEELERQLLKELEKELKRHLEEVRACPMTPGSLEPIMTRAAQAMARLTQETLAKAASREADFSPCARVSALPGGGASVQPGEKAKKRRDGLGGDPL